MTTSFNILNAFRAFRALPVATHFNCLLFLVNDLAGAWQNLKAAIAVNLFVYIGLFTSFGHRAFTVYFLFCRGAVDRHHNPNPMQSRCGY